MKKYILITLLLLGLIPLFFNYKENPAFTTPASYGGRFRPLPVYADLWLESFYHEKNIRKQDLKAFGFQEGSRGSSTELIWKMNFLGHEPWDHAPFFWVNNSTVKKLLGLNSEINRFSYRELSYALFENETTNLQVVKELLVYYFLKNFNDTSNRGSRSKQELHQLTPGLWVMLQDNDLVVLASPQSSPWNFLRPGMILAKYSSDPITHQQKVIADEIVTLLTKLMQYKQIENSQKITNTPHELLKKKLSQAGSLLFILPGDRNEWFPINALKVHEYTLKTDSSRHISNFTLYPDNLFQEIQSTYFQLEQAVITKKPYEHQLQKLLALLSKGYQQIANTKLHEASEKILYYPSSFQLFMEAMDDEYFLIKITSYLYGLSICFFIITFFLKREFFRYCAVVSLMNAFLIHTFILILRSLILQRPPVSNMFETILYVPWIAVLISFVMQFFSRQVLVLFVSAFSAFVLLVLLQLISLNNSFENLQPVLDSQYWLIIHVLMVVGSYGAFILSGIFGHCYLICCLKQKQENDKMLLLAKFLLQTMYLGVALLIPGTLLGGVWAAESWGRFWDWDPKESWAFISSCLYLIWIHAYRYKRIHHFGLAIGSIVGLISITFTWYGVNYLLGTGLHSYGFGSGGEIYYFIFLFAEVFFLAFVCYKVLARKRYWKTNEK